MSNSAIAGLGILLAGLALAVTPLTAKAQQQPLDQSVSTQQKIVKDAARTQQRVDKLSGETQQLQAEYLATTQHVDQLKKYNDNLQALINNQQSRVASLNKQLSQLSDVAHGIVPMMEQMIAGLSQFIKLDMPYHLKQREQTVQTLKSLMTDSDVSIAERYRQITNAYRNELDAGRTMDAYRGELTVNNKPQTVDFLRIGRVVLCYQTLNQSQTGCWNQRLRKWQVENGYRRSVSNGFQMARKQISPTLLILPVLPPQPASQQSQ